MDHLQEARDFVEFACERLDQGKQERAAMNCRIATAHALIAIAERLDIANGAMFGMAADTIQIRHPDEPEFIPDDMPF